MKTPLEGLGPDGVSADPYPHAVVTDVLDPAVCRQLMDELPPLEIITKTTDFPSNKGYALPAHEALEHPDVSPLWRELISACMSQELLDQVVVGFGEGLREMYGDRDFSGLRAGVRHVDTFADADVVMDAEILVTTPVVGETSSSRSPHVDDTTRMFNGQLYFRLDGDESPGGDVDLFRFRSGPQGFTERDIDPAVLEPVKTVPYDRNLFLMMLNGLVAVHAVTERPPTPQARYLINIIAHVEEPLFDVAPYQA